MLCTSFILLYRDGVSKYCADVPASRGTTSRCEINLPKTFPFRGDYMGGIDMKLSLEKAARKAVETALPALALAGFTQT